MYKTIGIFISILAFLTCVAAAGELVEISCDKCAYKSETLYEGSSGLGIAKGIIYCDTCKQFYSISIKNYVEDTTTMAQPTGKKEFMGKMRITYACPKCGSEAYLYYSEEATPGKDKPSKEEICPICKKGKLRKQMIGKWD